jgi:hypothetical protein
MADLPSNIINARTQAEQAEQYAGQLSSQVPTVGDVLKERVNKLFNENQDVFAGFNQAVGNLVSAPGKSYETTENIRDPFARERLAAIDLQTAYQPAAAYGSLLGQRMGNIADIVQSGSNAFTSQAQAAANAAQVQRQAYQDILNEFLQAQQLEMQRQQLEISRASAGRASAGESQAAEIKKLIQEASKLPANQRANYIMANGYNPYEATFAGVVPVPQTEEQRLTLEGKKAGITQTNLEISKLQEQAKKAAWSIWNPVSWFD